MNSSLKNSLSAQERRELAKKYAGLVKHIASRMGNSLPPHVELEDLIHDGVVGLMDALQRYDPGRGIKFETFAATRIRGAILDALRASDWASRGARRRSRELAKAEESLVQKLGRFPTPDEVGTFTGLPKDELRRRKHEMNSLYVMALEERKPGSSNEDERWSENLPDTTVSVEDAVLREQRKQMLMTGLKTLSEREQQILSLYYFDELSIKEVGKVFGVSEARISQIHGRCLRKMREFLGEGAPRGQVG